MKLITKNIIEADGAEPVETVDGFPLSNALPNANVNDERISVVWKGDDPTNIVINLKVTGLCSVISMHGVIADFITISAFSDSGKSTLIKTRNIDTTVTDEFQDDKKIENIWFEFTETTNVWFTIGVVTTVINEPKIGMFSAGVPVILANPEQGFKDSAQDQSMVNRDSGGGDHLTLRGSTRVLQGQYKVFNNQDTCNQIRQWIRVLGKRPIAIQYLSGINDNAGNEDTDSYVIFGSMMAQESQITNPNHQIFTLQAREFVSR
jgi:hypothetical protein